MKKLLLSVSIFVILISTTTFCQEDLASQQPIEDAVSVQDDVPSIGLAFSGGAAHGFAHIGVIRYMEELGIPVDYITGTSMGSIVGGLLSMGYRSEDMIRIAEGIDWDEIMSNRTKLDQIAPLEKFYHDKFPLLFTLEDKELVFPSGIISGQRLDMILSRIYFPALAVNNFDDLIIPFRCMAVDISSGEVLTLDSGYLGKAVRASMAIPLVFSPVEMDGRLLVDGGLIRNFPVQESIEMGADFVIGIYVGTEKAPKEELKSSFDILAQSTQMMGMIDSEKQMKLCDILIKPEVDDYPSLDFDNYRLFIERGYEAAKKHEDQFLALKERLGDKEVSYLGQKIIKTPTKMYVNKVTTPNVKSPMSDIILNRCGLGQRSYIKLDDIDEGLARIYGTKNFQNLNYKFYQDENFETNLTINAETTRKTEVGATFNRFASTNSSIILYGVFRNKFSEPSRLTLAGRLSDNPGLKAEYFKRFGHHRRIFSKAFLTAERFELPLFLDGDLRRLFKARKSDFGINVGYESDNAIKVEGGLKYASQSLVPLVLQVDDIISYDQDQLSLNVEATFNNMDKPAYPTKGISGEFRLSSNVVRSVLDNYTSVQARETLSVEEDNVTFSIFGSFQKVYPLDDKITAISSGYLYGRLGSSLLDNLSIGGSEQSRVFNVPFIGLGEGELIMKSAIVLRQEVRINPMKNIFLSAIGNIAVGEKAFGSLVMDFDNSDIIGGIGLNFGLNTPMGPIDLGFGVNTGGVSNVALGAGYRFIF